MLLQVPNPEQIEEDLEEILRRLGYITTSEVPKISQRTAEWGEFISILLRVIVVVALLVIILYFLMSLSRQSVAVGEPKYHKKRMERELIEKKDYSTFYKKAVELGKKGEYLDAVRLLYLGLLLLLDSTQVITYHPSLTNYEYRQAVSTYPYRTLFDNVTHTFDMVYYGARKATGEDFSLVMDAFTKIEEAVS
jgi:hypothetical protein